MPTRAPGSGPRRGRNNRKEKKKVEVGDMQRILNRVIDKTRSWFQQSQAELSQASIVGFRKRS